MQIEFFGEKTIPISENETILEASLNAEIPHFHICGGKAKCSTCRVLVLEGEENLSPPNKKETKLKETIRLPSYIRLACQTKVEKGPVKVERMMKDECDISQVLKINKEDPHKFKLQPVGEEKYLVLFFIDIRNFTPFVETYLPYDVIYIIRRLFGIFYEMITRHDGHVIETAGDELYAVFGLESSIREATDAAISAAYAIFDELDVLNKAYAKAYLPEEFEVGIGIHSGKAIVGEFKLGTEVKKSIMGLAVNIASRIQDSTKTLNNSFLVSDDVIKHSSFNTPAETKEVVLKGVSGSHKLYLMGQPYKT